MYSIKVNHMNSAIHLTHHISIP